MNANRKLADRCATDISIGLDRMPFMATNILAEFILRALKTQETRHKRLLRKIRTLHQAARNRAADRTGAAGEVMASLDDKGRCCGRKPLLYKRAWVTLYPAGWFCVLCDRAYDRDSGIQVENWAWRRTADGQFERRN